MVDLKLSLDLIHDDASLKRKFFGLDSDDYIIKKRVLICFTNLVFAAKFGDHFKYVAEFVKFDFEYDCIGV